MPFEFTKSSGVIMGTADKDYFLDEDRKVTTDTEKAAIVLIRKGQNIPKEMADKYGIGKEKPNTAEKAAEKALESKEKGSGPSEDKSATPTADKTADEAKEKE